MIICEICKKEYKKIDSQHLRKHNTTREEYQNQFPDAKMVCDELHKKLGDVNRGRVLPDESKNKIANSLRGRKNPIVNAEIMEKKINIAKANGVKNKGKKHIRSEEYCKNISNALKGKLKGPMNSKRYETQMIAVKKSGITKRQKTITELSNKIKSWGVILSENNGIVDIKCNICNSNLSIQLQTIRIHNYSNSACHTCHPVLKGTSNMEQELADYIKNKLNINIIQNVRGQLSNNYEIDILCPDFNIGIEFCGLYWHSSKRAYPMNKHKNKMEIANSKGLRLITIFEDEWMYKKDIVKYKLKNIFNKNSIKIGARKFKIKEITQRDVNLFFEQYHLQGGTISKYNYGLFKDDELYGCISFAKMRKYATNSTDDNLRSFEVIRYATKFDVNIVGGMSKLISNFKSKVLVDKLYSWADLRWTNLQKNIYTQIGFTKHHITEHPGFSYFNLQTSIRSNRLNFQRPKNCPSDMTAEQYWATMGYYKIYDCGQVLYMLE